MYSKILVLSVLAISCSIAFARENSANIPAVPAVPVDYQSQYANSNSNSASTAQAGAQVSNNPISGSGNHNYAIVGIPSYSSPLPAYNCPQGDSIAWSIGWNFFSYARSSTRTEMECLDKMLVAMQALRIPAPVLPVPAQIHPVCTTEYIDTPVFLVTDSKRDVPPRKAMAKKTVKVCK
jgi:hypothetical protein